VKCPRCGKDDDKVVDSRASAEGTVIRRRRECLACALRFTTYERVEESPLRVVKKNGDRVAFDREKIRSGMLRACEKLPVPVSLVDDAVARVETRCQADYDREVPSAVIGSAVMEELRKLHHVAYVRFASVYREFKDVQQFMHELQSILAVQPGSEGARSAEVSSPRSSEATPPRSAEASSTHGLEALE
jgi:transcriptional repressor NrdR